MTILKALIVLLAFPIVSHAANYNLTFDDDGKTKIDGNSFCNGVCRPGDTITLEATTTIDTLYVENVHGSGVNPIIIQNTSGRQTHIDREYNGSAPGYGWGLLVQRCSDIIIDGSNGYNEPNDSDTFMNPANTYFGIRISRAKDKGITLNEGTEGIEFRYIEIDNPGMDDGYRSTSGTPGIGIKNSNSLADDVITTGQELSGFNYHHMYIHETASEAMYLGPTGGCTGGMGCCDSKEDADGASIMHDTIVHHIYTKNTGWDSISVGCDDDVQIYLNYVENSGLGHFEGLGQGVCYDINRGSGGSFYRNIGLRCGKGGINYQGEFDLLVENNLIAETFQWKDPEHGRGQGFKDNGYDLSKNVTIRNNTFVNTGDSPAIVLKTDRRGLIQDNLFVDIGSPNIYGLTTATNPGVGKATVASCKFEDVASDNYDLTANTPEDIVGAGQSRNYPAVDLEGRTRTGSGVDLGAYKYETQMNSPIDLRVQQPN